MLRQFSFIIVLWSSLVAADEIRIPAATAYLHPDSPSIDVSADAGIRRWVGPDVSVTWYGQFSTIGQLNATVELLLPERTESKLKLTLDNQVREVTVHGQGATPVTAEFSRLEIASPGYHALCLHSLNTAGQPNGDIVSLGLSGPATQDAHFNLKSRRNAASVHLMYPIPKDVKASAFYCEMTGIEDPVGTYYMACGWHRGYFGMQVNGPTERRIIFSVWDSGNEAVDRRKVAPVDRVTLMAKGDDVVSGGFGNEGTGGHSHVIYPWKTGEKQRFIVTAEPVEQSHTIFSGYYFRPDSKNWMLISSWKAPKEDGKRLRRLYSFSENFIGSNGDVLRKALYGNQWIRTSDGQWRELTTAKFSCDPTGKADRRDRFMGLEDGQFFLSHGGFIDGFTEFGTSFTRPATGDSPEKMELPPLPPIVP